MAASESNGGIGPGIPPANEVAGRPAGPSAGTLIDGFEAAESAPASVLGVLGGVGGCPDDDECDDVGVVLPPVGATVAAAAVGGGAPRSAADSMPGANGDDVDAEGVVVGVAASLDIVCLPISPLEGLLLFRPNFSTWEKWRRFTYFLCEKHIRQTDSRRRQSPLSFSPFVLGRFFALAHYPSPWRYH